MTVLYTLAPSILKIYMVNMICVNLIMGSPRNLPFGDYTNSAFHRAILGCVLRPFGDSFLDQLGAHKRSTLEWNLSPRGPLRYGRGWICLEDMVMNSHMILVIEHPLRSTDLAHYTIKRTYDIMDLYYDTSNQVLQIVSRKRNYEILSRSKARQE